MSRDFKAEVSLHFLEKMTSFCQSENIIGFRIRVGVDGNTFLVKRIFKQVE